MQRIMRRCLVIVLSVVALFPSVASDPSLFDLVPEHVAELMERTTVLRGPIGFQEVTLLPDHRATDEIQALIDEVQPSIAFERLVFVAGPLRDDALVLIYNALRSVDELAGLRYYNAGRQRENTLFNSSFPVHRDDITQAITVSRIDALPHRSVLWVMQDTPPFGEIVSTYRYRAADGVVFMSAANQDPLVFRGVRVVQQNGMLTLILVIRVQEGMLMYGFGGARAFLAFGLLKHRIEPAFEGRARAMFDWFATQHLSRIPVP